MKKILFYASVKDPADFKTKLFFVNTTSILRQLGYEVQMTNRMKDAWTEDYDGFFCFFFRKGVVPAYIAKARGKKVFFTGGLDSLVKSITTAKDYYRQIIFFKLCQWIADYCLIESMSDMENIQRICLVKKHKNLYYSPQAIDMQKYECGYSGKENIFSTICWQGTEGNVKRKGVDRALYCYKALLADNRFSDYKLYIIGRKDLGTPYIEKIINELDLKEKVVITGEVNEDEKLNILKRSKYFFQLSNYEGFGLAALEALAARCIPIHSGKGGLADTLADDGILIDIDRFELSVDAVAPDLADRLMAINKEDIENAHKRIEKIFDEKIRLENFRKTIGKVMG